MSKKTPPPISGRAVPDEKGNQTWVWDAEGDINTAVVRSLGEGLSLDGAPAPNPGAGSNPYDRATQTRPQAPAPAPARAPAPAPDKPVAKRRTLDDMRKLSEAIKRAKHYTRD